MYKSRICTAEGALPSKAQSARIFLASSGLHFFNIKVDNIAFQIVVSISRSRLYVKAVKRVFRDIEHSKAATNLLSSTPHKCRPGLFNLLMDARTRMLKDGI